VTAAPPFEDGAVKFKVAWVSPDVTVVSVGAPGTVAVGEVVPPPPELPPPPPQLVNDKQITINNARDPSTVARMLVSVPSI